MMQVLSALALNDLRRVFRDRFLVGTLAFIGAMGLALRFTIPAAGVEVAERTSVTLSDYHPLMASYVALTMSALLAGLVGAFLLLEAKEEKVIDALRVSPLRLSRYLATEGLFVYVISVVLTLVMAGLMGYGAPPGRWLLICALTGSASAPVVALGVSATAHDKVQAFALLKIVGLLGFMPMLSWFVSDSMRWLFVPLPSAAAMMAWWQVAAEKAGSPWRLVAVSLVVNGVWLGASVWLFRRRIH